MKVKPTAEHIDEVHHVDIEWGPWIRSVDAPIPEKGLLLFTGKAADDDGIPRTCNLTFDKRVFVLHGAGDDFGGEAIIDMRRGWRVAPGETGSSRLPGAL
ncbi:hypothetical protein LV457_11695 [Mycobacterium sp. MYCO198283]|uniref:hypothetical protein n=1 Tax=Mycobacterium sp. MYCO198283 TaxID=2883505 RepID=UPI001E584504|nr:hypothetical protein [Mycobacterium sp. MYCO198283]MCG5432944.1 hypothetical protein [Mycobacterium sp. MYCO198283]